MDKTARMMKKWKERYKDRFPDIINSYGDTPSCSLAKSLSDFDEVRPGNFVYFDLMQHQLNACAFDDIAVAVACPVVSVYPYRNELIIYGGAVHLSNEYLADDNGRKIYGYIVRLNENGWSDPIPGAYVSSPSQEHGIVRMETEELVRFKPGDVLGVLPVHSCLTANLLKQECVFIQPR
jgi:D-serine deaminase-like pyridoxal phosphate-dependent protein